MIKRWSSPFEKWVIDSWEEHSKAIGGPEIAKQIHETLANPEEAKKRAFSKRCKTKNIAP